MTSKTAFNDTSDTLFEGFKMTAHRWFPVDPAVLELVHQRHCSKHYHHRPQDLIADVRSDASLYLFCVRKLRRIIRSCSTPEDTELLSKSIGYILTELTAKQVHHCAGHSLPFQVERRREIVLSSTVVDLLGEKLALDRDAGFTCALLRQLGYALIAWNYPLIYRQALEDVAAQGASGRTDLNTVLHANLGFSPATLGLRFAESWGLPNSITGEIGSQAQYEPVQPKGKGSLSVLCEIGEAFARASNPHNYPNPRDDWDRAINVLNHHLGPDGIRVIQQRAGTIYGEAVKRLLPTCEQAAADSGRSFGEALFNSNLFVKALPSELQEQVRALYSRLSENKVNPELIRLLLQEIAPRLGFGSAVVYTLDPADAALNPVFRKGKPRFTTLRPVSTSSRPNDTDPIRRSFLSDLVICEEGRLPDGTARMLLVLPIRGRTRIGVIYLEQSDETGAESSVDCMLGAKLIASSLKDLLLLGTVPSGSNGR